jgi:hypothetical protein
LKSQTITFFWFLAFGINVHTYGVFFPEVRNLLISACRRSELIALKVLTGLLSGADNVMGYMNDITEKLALQNPAYGIPASKCSINL